MTGTTEDRTKRNHCIHCDKKLSLIQILLKARFCSEAHQQLYDSARAGVMLERLLKFE